MTSRRSRIRLRGSAIARIPKAVRFAAGSRRLPIAAVVCASGLVLVASAAGALEARLAVSPKRPAALEPTQVVVRTYVPRIRTDGSCGELGEPYAPRSYPFRVEAVSPAGKTSRIRVRWARGNEFRGVFHFPSPGRWHVQLPQFRQSIAVSVRPPVPTAAPTGFGSLGQPGCAPPSPAGSKHGFRTIFGTASGGERLWALPSMANGATWSRSDAAVFDGLVGKEIKIVFAMTSVAAPFHAIGPEGTTLEPVWRRGHNGRTWVGEPGHQWGAGFVFPEAGCWRIRVGPRGSLAARPLLVEAEPGLLDCGDDGRLRCVRARHGAEEPLEPSGHADEQSPDRAVSVVGERVRSPGGQMRRVTGLQEATADIERALEDDDRLALLRVRVFTGPAAWLEREPEDGDVRGSRLHLDDDGSSGELEPFFRHPDRTCSIA